TRIRTGPACAPTAWRATRSIALAPRTTSPRSPAMTATPRPAGARSIVSAFVLAACAPTSNADDPRAVPPIDGQDAIEAWFDAGHYLAWPCQTMAQDAPPHGRIRVC